MNVGDVWTFVAIDADTKLVPCWRLGGRDEDTTNEFIYDLSQRIPGRVQITSDGLATYPFAIEGAFEHGRVDCGMLIKTTPRLQRKNAASTARVGL